MPDPGPMAYLFDLLNRIGPALNAGNGLFALTYQEIESWSRLTGTQLEAQEAEVIRGLSKSYAGAVMTYSGSNEPAPYRDDSADRTQINQEIEHSMRGFFAE